MAKFIYKLQNILDIKYKLEDLAKQEYADATSALLKEQSVLEKLRYKRYETMKEYKNSLLGKLDFLSVQEYENSLKFIDSRIDKQIQVVRQKNKELELARVKLNTSMQERKIHEKLKENKFEELKKELTLEEIKEIDELISFKYNDNGSGKED